MAVLDWVQARLGSRRAAPGLVGTTGRFRLDAGGHVVATVHVADGFVSLERAGTTADAVFTFVDESALAGVLSGRLNPVVAVLRDMLVIEGDTALGIRCLLGLPVGAPFGGDAEAETEPAGHAN
jgi:hypothetical protein